MSRFCGGDINFNVVEFDELIGALVGPMKFSLHYKWLHDQFHFWKEEMTRSNLFNENEIKTLLPILVPYLCQLFENFKKVECHKTFMRCVNKDNAWRHQLFQYYNWKCLLMEPVKGNQNPEEQQEDERTTSKIDSNAELCSSSSSNFSLGLSHSEGFKHFDIQLHYILDLLFPNNFQYYLYKLAFSSIFVDKEITSPYPLRFPKKYFSADVVDKTEKKDQPKKKEKKLNLPKPPPLEVPAKKTEEKPQESIPCEDTILPLHMACEIDEDFWKTLGEKHDLKTSFPPPPPDKNKGKKVEEKKKTDEKEEGKTDDKAHDNKKEKKKDKKKEKK